MKRAFLATPILLSLLLTYAAVLAQQKERGAIAGAVTDARTGAFLEGASLMLEESGLGVVAGPGGRFQLAGIQPGTHTLIVSFVGYRTLFQKVSVLAGKEVTLSIRLGTEPIQLHRTLIDADPVSVSVSSSRPIRDFDLRIRPHRSSQDLLQTVPGLVTARHAGGGKAEQIFIRGFDCGFGTDVAISVDGMPVNLVSHGHSQGYADLHFLIPEVVEQVEVFKGPYFAEFGNLASAGQILFRTRERLSQNSIRVERGSFNTARATALYQLPAGNDENGAYFAGDYYRTDGPFASPQDLHRLTVFAKLHHRLSSTAALTLHAGGTGSTWDAPGLIPQREIDRGNITRWGTLNDAEGGSTARQNLILIYQATDEAQRETFLAQLYLSDYSLKLFSDYTFFLQDGIYGDMVEQTDGRLVAGLNSRYSRRHAWGPVLGIAALGGGFRADNVELALWQVVERRRYWPLVDDAVRERNLFLWGQEELIFGSRWRLVLGLRGDYFTFQVEDRLEVAQEGVRPLSDWLKEIRTGVRRKPLHVPLVQAHASGVAQQFILSPKASLVCSPADNLDLFVNFGTGFHSSDARSAVIGQFLREQWLVLEDMGATPQEIAAVLEALNFSPAQRDVEILPRTVGGEAGFRLRSPGRRGTYQAVSFPPSGPSSGHYPGSVRFHAPVVPLPGYLNLGAALWWIDVEDELIYAADAGTTEKRGRTRRWGVDLEARLQLLPWLWGDADLNWARGRLRDAPANQDAIPLAPRFTANGGLTARIGDLWEGSLRYRHVGDRPALEDRSIEAEGHALFDLNASCHAGPLQIDLSVENLLDKAWNEAQFAIESMTPQDWEILLRGEIPPGADLHFTPGNPRSMQIGVRYLY